jgi:hypothetical protein
MLDPSLAKDWNVLLIGGSTPLEELYGWFVNRPAGETWFVSSEDQILDIAGHNRIHLVLIEPKSWGPGNLTALMIFKLREVCPEGVIVILANEDEFQQTFAECSAEVKHRLTHYYRVHRKHPTTDEGSSMFNSADSESLKQVLIATEKWHEQYQGDKAYPIRYAFDVAISFAGEDRATADTLANALKNAGLHVFYDNFEQANLWGKNLFTTLYDVYSHQARYCIILISKWYVDKEWTVHERRAAQERVLNERDNEYLLPIRLDKTPLPGLPNTIAYLDASIGMDRVANLFIQKITEKLALRSRSSNTG